MSFRTKLFLVISTLAGAMMAVSILIVNQRFKSNTLQYIEREMATVHLRFDRFLGERIDNLITQTINLSTDARLRGSIATGDSATVRLAAEEIGRDAGVDILHIYSAEGALFVSADRSQMTDRDTVSFAVVQDALNGYDSGDIWLSGGSLFLVAATQIRAGDANLGILLTGKQFKDYVSQQFSELTGLQVAFFQEDRILTSSLSNRQQAEFLLAVRGLKSTRSSDFDRAISVPVRTPSQQSGQPVIQELWIEDEPYTSALMNLTDVSGHRLVNGAALRSIKPEYSLLANIQAALITEGVLAILVSVLIGYILSRSLTRPIQRLVDESKRLGAGQMEEPIAFNTADEFGTLADALDNMRASLLKARGELIRSERLSTIGQMASSIIHDFRQPISALYGFVDLLTMPGIDAKSREEFKENIFKQVDRMLGMINELLDFARGDAKLNRKEVELNRFLSDLTGLFERECRASGISLTLELGPDQSLSIDENRLQRGVENIIRNAMQAMKSGGRIRLSTMREDGQIVVRISDTGPGVPQKIADSLFDPFITHGKEGGTGLGLAVAKKVVAEHGGSLTLAENSPQGATFEIKLPITAQGD